VACAIRTVVAVVVAIALAGGWLTLPLLLMAAIILGAGQALGGAAHAAAALDRAGRAAHPGAHP
jgi:hypothetical protein